MTKMPKMAKMSRANGQTERQTARLQIYKKHQRKQQHQHKATLISLRGIFMARHQQMSYVSLYPFSQRLPFCSDPFTLLFSLYPLIKEVSVKKKRNKLH